MPNNIVYIPGDKLHPHPQNPRKDLGDLSELAESIKANGILQNLTVVPDDVDLYHKKVNGKKAYTGEYTVIIGHRRHGAGKLAGLTEYPCVISTMDQKQQVSTMLLENMQRSDLTVWEEAQGFQMMLDLGDTEADIAAKTGFSKSTVRRRVKMLELDPNKFKKAVERGGATLEDYAKLEKIEDLEARNKVLDVVGTSNFAYQLQKALDEQQWRERKAGLIKQLREFAIELPDLDDDLDDDDYDENEDAYECIESYYRYGSSCEVETPEDAGEIQYFYKDNDSSVYLYIRACDIKEEDEDRALTPEELARKKRTEKRDALDEISKRAYQLRHDFIRNFSATKNIQLKSWRWPPVACSAIMVILTNPCCWICWT